MAITEFGCGTYRGAAANGATSILDWHGGVPHLKKGEHVRDEAEQAACVRELLEIFETEGVDSAFVYCFANYELVHRAAPGEDLDMASFGIVKVSEDGGAGQQWAPKAAFGVVAEWYGRDASC